MRDWRRVQEYLSRYHPYSGTLVPSPISRYLEGVPSPGPACPGRSAEADESEPSQANFNVLLPPTERNNEMAKPAFINLWTNYPTESSPCDGPWDNQCAIRMSITLNAEMTLQVNATTYSEPKCSHGHARGAESLANWLWSRNRLGRPTVYSDGASAKQAIAGKTGIVFFKDCFTRSGQTTRAGDHIDLWNKGLTKTYSDPANKSAQVWFWELP